jgi:hypothetical protein
VERQLGGTTRFDWRVEGLQVTLQLPPMQMRRGPAVSPAAGTAESGAGGAPAGVAETVRAYPLS